MIKIEARRRRSRKLRSRTAEQGRHAVSVNISNKHIYAQVISPNRDRVVFQLSTLSKGFKGEGKNKKSAAKIGELLGKELVKRKISPLVFDRGGRKYHGKVKEIADGLRKSGIKI